MFPSMQEPLKPRNADPLFRRASFGLRNPRHTWDDLAAAAGVPKGHEKDFLWSGSAYPFARARYIFGQLRHVLRHKVCFDNPGATCQSKRLWRHA